MASYSVNFDTGEVHPVAKTIKLHPESSLFCNSKDGEPQLFVRLPDGTALWVRISKRQTKAYNAAMAALASAPE